MALSSVNMGDLIPAAHQLHVPGGGYDPATSACGLLVNVPLRSFKDLAGILAYTTDSAINDEGKHRLISIAQPTLFESELFPFIFLECPCVFGEYDAVTIHQQGRLPRVAVAIGERACNGGSTVVGHSPGPTTLRIVTNSMCTLSQSYDVTYAVWRLAYHKLGGSLGVVMSGGFSVAPRPGLGDALPDGLGAFNCSGYPYALADPGYYTDIDAGEAVQADATVEWQVSCDGGSTWPVFIFPAFRPPSAGPPPVSGGAPVPPRRKIGDVAPQRTCPKCGGEQRLRKTCRGGSSWKCQEPGCRHTDVVVPGRCR